MLSDSAVLSRRRNLRSSKSADRLTPAHPERELAEPTIFSRPRMGRSCAHHTTPEQAARS